MNLRELFWERVRFNMKAKNISINILAVNTNQSRQALEKLMSRKANIGIESVDKYAAALQVSIFDLLSPSIKRYMVACYDKTEAINAMHIMFKRLKSDFGKRELKIKQDKLLIVGDKIEIVFYPKNLIFKSDVVFDGVAKTQKFEDLTGGDERNHFLKHFNNTSQIHGMNDKDGILKMYLVGKI